MKVSVSSLSRRMLCSIVVFAVLAVIATALAQIFTNTYQKSLDCNALQLLYHTSPYIALVRIVLLSIRFSNFFYLILTLLGNVDYVSYV